MQTQWVPQGYPPPGLFAGAWFCRFRMCHMRGDGLSVTTLGHQVGRGARLEPITNGFNFMSWVSREIDKGGEIETIELARAACNDARTAQAQHMALLTEWNDREDV